MTGFLCSNFTAGQHVNGGLQAIITPGIISTTGMGSTTSTAMSVSPLGGMATYSKAWSELSATHGITINSPTSASTTTTVFLNPGDFIQTFFLCEVTDGAPTVVKSNQITMQFQYG